MKQLSRINRLSMAACYLFVKEIINDSTAISDV